MKFDELKEYPACVPTPKGKILFIDAYPKEDVDNAIAELRRALFRARSEWARSAALSYHLIENHPDKDAAATYRRKANKWEKVQKACAKYAEKIKGAK